MSWGLSVEHKEDDTVKSGLEEHFAEEHLIKA